jgi:hypothetical protein
MNMNKKVPHGPAFPKSSEQIVSKMLTIFLKMPVACLQPFCSSGSDSEQVVSILLTKFFVWMPVACLRAIRAF